ncbi:chromate transporter [Christensenellaceae bacterium OttesenSCG-928-K19]|nr:chromate transporter [Christensenellaceae bacterium OttesenSCG-928-K19]
MSLLKLLIDFLQIGTLSFGGGYAVIPLIQQVVIDTNGWLTMGEYTDIITISQMTPGPLAVNTSTFVGARLAELPGAITATLGCVLPGVLISFVLYQFFRKKSENLIVGDVLQSLKAATAGLIAAAAATILLLLFFGVTDIGAIQSFGNYPALVVFAVCLICLRKFKWNPLIIIGASGAAGLLLYL